MGCQMSMTKRDPDENPDRDPNTPNLLSLPNEVLVKILSFLPETRDRLKLRYVSQKLRSVSETPSLWRDFVWPHCGNPREEKCLESVMKACGMHIRRASFQHLNEPTSNQTALKSVKISKMAKMLQHCSNLTHLTLPALDDASSHKRLREAIQKMRCLEMLSIHCHANAIQPYLSLQATLKELTIHTVIHSKNDIKVFRSWMVNGFTPPNLNIVVLKGSMYSTLIRFREFLVPAWHVWNSQIPAGRVACLRLYSSYKVPLNLFQSTPVFQLRYGEAAATLPFVRGHSIGVPGWLILTDCDDSGKMMYKAKVYQERSFPMYDIIHDYEQGNQLQTDINFTNLTELDLSKCNLDIKQIVLACPHLQQLNLEDNRSLRLDDLKMIATCCHNLQGLNLTNTATPADIQFCIGVWEILSGMKLTHLSMDSSFFGTQVVADNDNQLKQLTALFTRCTELQALELHGNYSRIDSKRANDIYKLLFHFPSLEYCRLNRTKWFTCVEDIISTCERLKCFYCSCKAQLSLSSAYNNNLQQLCISSRATDVDDNFMHTMSAHGGLVHVAFLVRSMSGKGITTLIKNSPNLLTFIGLCREEAHKESYFEPLRASLGKKFAHRKLFTSGLSLIRYWKDDNLDDLLRHTDLSSLRPSEFADFEISFDDVPVV